MKYALFSANNTDAKRSRNALFNPTTITAAFGALILLGELVAGRQHNIIISDEGSSATIECAGKLITFMGSFIPGRSAYAGSPEEICDATLNGLNHGTVNDPNTNGAMRWTPRP